VVGGVRLYLYTGMGEIMNLVRAPASDSSSIVCAELRNKFKNDSIDRVADLEQNC